MLSWAVCRRIADMTAQKNIRKGRPAKCKVCSHPDRAAIEMTCVTGAALSWTELASVVNKAYGTDFRARTLQNHMANHHLEETALEAGIIMKGIVNEDGETPRITAQSMLQTMFIQGARDVAEGKIRPRNVGEMLQIMEAMERLQKAQEERDFMADGDRQGFYMALAAIGEAVKSVVTPEQLASIVARSQAIGMKMDFTAIPVQAAQSVTEIDYDVIADDYDRLGRARTREELVAAGVMTDEEELNGILDA